MKKIPKGIEKAPPKAGLFQIVFFVLGAMAVGLSLDRNGFSLLDIEPLNFGFSQLILLFPFNTTKMHPEPGL